MAADKDGKSMKVIVRIVVLLAVVAAAVFAVVKGCDPGPTHWR
jgi:hypothetical protein